MVTRLYPQQKGFTLIELLIVIAVIGILATGVILLIDPVAIFARARDSQRKSDLKQIQTALELYRQDTGNYPAQPDENTASIIDGSTTFLSEYLATIPRDPLYQNGCTNWPWTGKCYRYMYQKITAPSTGECSYVLIALLENTKDPSSSFGVTPAPTKNCSWTPNPVASSPYYYVGQ